MRSCTATRPRAARRRRQRGPRIEKSRPGGRKFAWTTSRCSGYSALTFNGHRIHYDRRYATEVEGYPGLVVHGPLIATLLLELLRRNIPGAKVAGFEVRAVNALFDVAPFFVCGRRDDDRSVRLWATTADGALATEGTATLAS